MRKILLVTSLFLAGAASAADVEHSFQRAVARGGVKRIVIDVPISLPRASCEMPEVRPSKIANA